MENLDDARETADQLEAMDHLNGSSQMVVHKPFRQLIGRDKGGIPRDVPPDWHWWLPWL
jgi:hypothetical protein